jgi:WD40 repeat protein
MSRRRYIEIAISAYDPNDEKFIEDISAQCAVVREWLVDDSKVKEFRFSSSAPKKLNNVDDLREFLEGLDLKESDDDEALVIYITGHGIISESREHYLLLPETDLNHILSRAFPTARIVTEALDSRADHVLVMVDSCFAGALRYDLQKQLRNLPDARRHLESLVVISSANDEDRPHPKQFSNLLKEVIDYCKDRESGFTRSHLTHSEFRNIMTDLYSEGLTANVQTLWPEESLRRDVYHRQPSPCLPNPGYRPRPVLVQPARSAVAWNPEEAEFSWLSHASGRRSNADIGWYFTGRADLVRRMVEFHREPSGTLIVTGEAGSGKSALLAYFVTLSDPIFRADDTYRSHIKAIPPHLLVPEGAVDAAVLAHAIDTDDLPKMLYELLSDEPYAPSEQSRPIDRLLDHILATAQRRRRPLTIVIDGIDEAKNPEGIISVVRRLADLRTEDELTAVRLLLGIRSERVNRLHPTPDDEPYLLDLLRRSTRSFEVLRTDVDSASDIQAYASGLLRSLFKPAESSNDQRLDEIAAAVAEEVAPSFLDARLAVGALYEESNLPDPDEPEWRRTLGEGTRGLIRRDVIDVASGIGYPAEHVLQALRATAFAHGSGLSWKGVWPHAANALAGGGITDPEVLIRKLMERRLAGYLTTSEEDGRQVYRPIHQRISEILRQPPHVILREGTALPPEEAAERYARDHKRVALAFRNLPTPAGRTPPPYVCRHLAQHAADGGVLNDSVVTADFLPYETSGKVRGALGLLSEHAPDTARLRAWARIEPFLADAPISARAESLRFALWEKETPSPSPSDNDPDLRRLIPLWKNLSVPANVLAQRAKAEDEDDVGDLFLVSFSLGDGTPLIGVGGADGTVQVWDPSSASRFGPPIPALGRSVKALAAVSGPRGEPLLAIGGEDGAWMFDPQTRMSTELPVGEQVNAMALFCALDGTPRLAIGTDAGLAVCDPLAEPASADDAAIEGPRGLVNALGTLELPDGRTLLAVHRAQHVEIRDGASLDLVCTVAIPGENVSALALLDGGERGPELAVATPTLAEVTFWNALTGARHRSRTIRRSANVLAPYSRSGTNRLLALGSDDGSVSLWDAGTCEEVCRFPRDHTGSVTALAVIPGHDGIPVLVSGARDGSVRVWNSEFWTHRTVRSAPPPDGGMLAVIPSGSGSATLVTFGPDRNPVTWSAVTGQPSPIAFTGLPFARSNPDVAAIAPCTAPDGSATVAIGLWDGTVSYLCRDTRPKHAWAAVADRPTALTAFSYGGDTVLAVGTSRGTVAFCPLGTEEPPELFWDLGAGPVHALTYLPLASGEGVLAAATDGGVWSGRPFQELDTELDPILATGPVSSLAAYPIVGDSDDGGEWRLTTGGKDGRLRVWDPVSGEEVWASSSWHGSSVAALEVVRRPGGRPLLVSVGEDTTVRAWDLRTGVEELRLVTAVPLTSLAVLPPRGDADAAPPVIAFGGPAGIAVADLHVP